MIRCEKCGQLIQPGVNWKISGGASMHIACPSDARPPSASEILARIQNYLGNGGLFNPEMMEHDKVRALIMDCRACIEAHHETVKWIASQQNLFFAECSQAEEIISRCASLLNGEPTGGVK